VPENTEVDKNKSALCGVYSRESQLFKLRLSEWISYPNTTNPV